jgi:hypothetical protein
MLVCSVILISVIKAPIGANYTGNYTDTSLRAINQLSGGILPVKTESISICP